MQGNLQRELSTQSAAVCFTLCDTLLDGSVVCWGLNRDDAGNIAAGIGSRWHVPFRQRWQNPHVCAKGRACDCLLGIGLIRPVSFTFLPQQSVVRHL